MKTYTQTVQIRYIALDEKDAVRQANENQNHILKSTGAESCNTVNVKDKNGKIISGTIDYL